MQTLESKIANLLCEKYKDKDIWLSYWEMKVEFDEKDTPFKLNTEEEWRLDVVWKNTETQEVDYVNLVELVPNDFNYFIEERTRLNDLSKAKQQKLLNFLKGK